MLIAGLSSIAINMNPLIKLDGYFALVDYLEIPNLSDDAASYVTALARRYIFRVPVAIPNYNRRMRRILLSTECSRFSTRCSSPSSCCSFSTAS